MCAGCDLLRKRIGSTAYDHHSFSCLYGTHRILFCGSAFALRDTIGAA
jgi:hypothetical protein